VFAGVGVLAALGLGFIGLRQLPNEDRPAPAAAAAPAIAVLPFATISSDSGDAYIAAGMTDQLTSSLARVPGWRVASRRAVQQAQDEDTTGNFAAALGLSHLVEGAVQRQGQRLRVAVRLIDGTSGFSLWSEVFEYAMQDIFAVQDAIAREIADAITAATGAGDSAAGSVVESRVGGTAHAEAYEHYLRARFLFARRDSASLREALAEYQTAARLDSSFARAHAGIATVYAVLPLYGRVARPVIQDSGLRAAERAIAADSGLADGYAARGVLHNAAWNWTGAEADFRRAIALDSTHAAAHQWLGDNLVVNGRVTEAVAAYREAVRLDPVTPVLRATYAYALAVASMSDSALAQVREALRLDPASPVVRVLVGHAYLALGRLSDARRELETANSQAPGMPLVLGGLGAALAADGQRDRAEDVLARLAALPPRSGAAFAMAKVHLGLGDAAAAMRALQSAVLEHDEMIGSESMAAPLYAPLRSLPPYAEILRAARLNVARLTATR
jgi:TolB-like protein/Flp pilus assembly protein TadD